MARNRMTGYRQMELVVAAVGCMTALSRSPATYLARQGHDMRAMQFRTALDLPDRSGRRQAAAKAVNAIMGVMEVAGERATSRF